MSAARPIKRAKSVADALLQTVSQTVVISPGTEPDGGSLSTPVIGTHDGNFHCDEALACAMLRMLPKYSDAYVLRTRKPEALEKCTVVVDVGGEYNFEALRFDHHQKTFEGTLDGYKTKLSSAGLVYKHFGAAVIDVITNNEMPEKLKKVVYEKVYKNFVEHIDGIDNGIEVADGELRYNISTTLSARVGKLHPSWNEDQSTDIVNARFRSAVELCATEFIGCVTGLHNTWLPARTIVEDMVNKAPEVHASGAIAIMEQFAPWQSHLFDIEAEHAATAGVLKYVLYADSRGMWRIQAVPEAPGSFKNRLPLPAPWRGLRDAALVEASGITGASFVHAAGFIGGNATKEGVVEMAIAALAFKE